MSARKIRLSVVTFVVPNKSASVTFFWPIISRSASARASLRSAAKLLAVTSSATASKVSPAAGWLLKPKICIGKDGPAASTRAPAESFMARTLAQLRPDTR